MKIHRHVASGILAALVLACPASRTQAQTIITNTFTFTFANGGATSDFNSTWLYYYNSSGYNYPMMCDPTKDASNNPGSGSLMVVSPLAGHGENIFFGTFASNINYAYDFSVEANFLDYSNISFDILVASNTPLNGSGIYANYGSIGVGIINTSYEYQQLDYGSVTIPASAATNWYHAVVPVDSYDKQNLVNPTAVPGIAFDINSDGGYPLFTITNWIDNISANAAPPPPPPPPPVMSISPAVQGLNLFTGSGNGLYNRESLETTTNVYSWVGAPSPVSYSFTIANYPVPLADQVQNHIFLIPNPGTNSAPDYEAPNVIFLDLESTATGGAQWTFRYKTNEPEGNAMIYGSGALATIGANTAIGTWTLTFNNDTNVTMTIPGGASTNFNIPDATGATSALFASGVVLYYGVQANSGGAVNDHMVASDFKVTGLGSADFDDNFVTDAGTLDHSIWEVNATFTNSVQLVGPADPYWVQWTTPAAGFILQSTPALPNNSTGTPTTSNPAFAAGTFETQLISTNDLPQGNSAFFTLVKRTFSQLLVLLPGETNAPNTLTGKIGTPAPFSLSASGSVLTFTVLAVDAHWYPVPGSIDTLAFTDNDGGTYENPFALANGSGQCFVFYQSTASNVAITAMDSSNPTITPNTSTAFTVGP